MPEMAFQQAYPLALRVAQARARAAVLSGAARLAERDDFQQEGLAACWRSLPQFDASRASLRTFMERVVASRITSLVRSTRPMSQEVSIDAAANHTCSDDASDLNFNADLDRISASLQTSDRQLILVLLEYSPTEASRVLGISRSTLYKRIARLRPHFAAAGYAPRGVSREGSAR